MDRAQDVVRERRRLGRVKYANPHLIALLRHATEAGPPPSDRGDGAERWDNLRVAQKEPALLSDTMELDSTPNRLGGREGVVTVAGGAMDAVAGSAAGGINYPPDDGVIDRLFARVEGPIGGGTSPNMGTAGTVDGRRREPFIHMDNADGENALIWNVATVQDLSACELDASMELAHLTLSDQTTVTFTALRALGRTDVRERRRLGRVKYTNPHLIALLRHSTEASPAPSDQGDGVEGWDDLRFAQKEPALLSDTMELDSTPNGFGGREGVVTEAGGAMATAAGSAAGGIGYPRATGVIDRLFARVGGAIGGGTRPDVRLR
jgi:hypothetical protein